MSIERVVVGSRSALVGLELRALRNARSALGMRWEDCSPGERLRAMSLAVREVIVDSLIATQDRLRKSRVKRVCYLSAEFLIGRSLGNNLRNLEVFDACEESIQELEVSLDDLLEQEPDAALGNGGLGRLAACFLDSLATLHMPAVGYGIRYDFGLFRQEFRSGRQVELADGWCVDTSPWLVCRGDRKVQIPIYGTVEPSTDAHGQYLPLWVNSQTIVGVPYDLPVVGYGGGTVVPLRLFAARSATPFDLSEFTEGHYSKAVRSEVTIETVSKVLYPCDGHAAGRELRLVQEYFLVAAALRDMVVDFEARETDYRRFADRFAAHLNDTHPSLMVAELMRFLVDEREVPWETAWEITRKTCAYTNHTLLPEALETWPVELLARVLPRHLQIIYEINHRFLEEVKVRWPDDESRRARMSLVDEAGDRRVRMAHLAMVGSHSVNGVSALHTDLLKTTLVRDFAEMTPEKFNNKTNGITPRRWLKSANPLLSYWISDRIGDGWVTNLSELRNLESHASDGDSLDELLAVKRRNKQRLAARAFEVSGVRLDPESLFDIQAKRIHEYKRQLLNAVHVVWAYGRFMDGLAMPVAARSVIFAGKAAPGYQKAKRIIEFIHHVATVVNADRRTRDALSLCFLPDYRVSLAERLIPAADLSEQISTAGEEASGTGNMKFALNGALTIGTRDGANVEIGEEVGEDNIYFFGLSAAEVQDLRPRYDPTHVVNSDDDVACAVRWLAHPMFNPDGRFQDIVDGLLSPTDRWLHLADLGDYLRAQTRVLGDYADRSSWSRRSLRNIAGMGRFSADRTISEYASQVWDLRPLPPVD